MHREYFSSKTSDSLLHFSRSGKGKKVLLAFHGFGLTHKAFNALEEQLQEEYTIYNFDLFYHGGSFWHKKEEPLTKEKWIGIIEKVFEDHQIKNFGLLCFSMGGKFVLSITEAFPERVKELILIAPDGIKTNFWYNIATYPSFLRKIFRRIVTRPVIYFRIVNFLRSLRLIDKGIVRFANTQMQTRKQRRQVFYSWVVFRKLKIQPESLAAQINRHNIKVSLFLGKYDKIITWGNLKSFFDKLENKEVNILEAGHTNLIDAVADFYRTKK